MFIVSCGKEENNEIKAKNIKEIVSDVNEITVELGARVDFEFIVTVVYEDETTKDFLLQDENYENDNVYIHINDPLIQIYSHKLHISRYKTPKIYFHNHNATIQ